jgi:hypothetical protein
MYGLALCLPSVGQPQGLPIPHEILKTQVFLIRANSSWRIYHVNLCSISQSELTNAVHAIRTTHHVIDYAQDYDCRRNYECQ